MGRGGGDTPSQRRVPPQHRQTSFYTLMEGRYGRKRTHLHIFNTFSLREGQVFKTNKQSSQTNRSQTVQCNADTVPVFLLKKKKKKCPATHEGCLGGCRCQPAASPLLGSWHITMTTCQRNRETNSDRICGGGVKKRERNPGHRHK